MPSKSGTVSRRGKLTERQRLFAIAYAADPARNAKNAAIAAGSPEKSARTMGSKWLAKGNIQALIKTFLDKQMQKFEISANRVINEFARIAYANMLDYIRIDKHGIPTVDLRHITRDQGVAIQSVTIEGSGKTKRMQIKLFSKTQPLELLGRYLKMFDQEEWNPNADIKRILVVDVPRPVRPVLPPAMAHPPQPNNGNPPKQDGKI